MDRRKTDRREYQPQNIEIPSIGEIIGIFFKRRLLIVILMFSPIVVGGVILKTKPDMYIATASVLIENQQLNLAAFQDILGDLKFDNLTVPTQVQVISSPNLIQETIATLKLRLDENNNFTVNSAHDSAFENAPESSDYDITQIFLENLDVKQQGASRVIDISFQSNTPQAATTIANGHTKQYVYSQIHLKKKQAEHINDWISKQIVQLKEESLRKSRAVQKFRAENGMIIGRDSQELVYQQISDIAAQLTPIETKELDLIARKDMIRSKNGEAITEIVESNLIQSLKSKASEASQKLQALRAEFGEKHPQIIALRKEVAQINGDIQSEENNIRTSIENELKTISKQKIMLEQKLQELRKQADISQENQITLQALQVDEAASAKLLDSFLARSEEIKSQIDFTRPEIRIVSLADMPTKPSGSKKAILMILIGMFSIIFALGTALLLEFIDDGIQKKDDVKRFLNLKLLGCLPKEKNPIKSILDKKRNIYSEEIKRLYIHLSSQQNVKKIVFTSAVHAEGKSTVATSLAYYLNSIGKKTIIIDADTFAPTISGITMVPQKPGFYELLAGINTINDVIKKDKAGIFVIPSGEQSNFISDLLLSGKFDVYIESLNAIYDYVIIDTGPILYASDAEVLSKIADQMILVVHWGKTPIKSLKKATEIIRQFTKTAPYVILNKVNSSDLKEK